MSFRQPPLVIAPGEAGADRELPLAVVVHLSGPGRGTSQRLTGQILRLGAGPTAQVRVSAEPMVAEHHATLSRRRDTYELRAEPGRPVWVNGESVRERLLRSGDVLEIGRDGPILRFRLYPPGTSMSKSVAEAFLDGVDGARFGGGSSPRRIVRGITGTVRELATQTTRWFRFGASLAFIALLGASIFLYIRSGRIEQHLEREALKIEGLAALLEESRRAESPEDLEALSSEVRATLERVEALEARSDAPARIVAELSPSVILLQGTYGFVEPLSGDPLRFFTLDEQGHPIRNPAGEPLVGVGGDGPVVEAQFLGTAFVISRDGLILTNRHVARPWEYESAAKRLVAQGLVPSLRRLVGFLPRMPEPFEATFVGAADDADLALLRISGLGGSVQPLPLASAPPASGDEVIVLGYPAGINALLARSETDLVERLMRDPEIGFWEITSRLAKAGEIGPLASRGIVAQVTSAAVVYDAETSRGGSGGPVINLDGEVIAITSGIVTEFGGSNLGVPVERARQLLAAAEPPAPERADGTRAAPPATSAIEK